MRIIHQTRNLRYRKPFGAVSCDNYVDLYLDVVDHLEDVDFILLNYAYGLKDFTEGKIMMQADEADPEKTPGRYHVRLRTPGLPSLLFYWFEVRKSDKSIIYVSKNTDTSGTAVLTTQAPRYQANVSKHALPFQITVYEKDYTVPSWYSGHLMYQIFPDRFKRGEDYNFERMREAHHSKLQLFHEDWNDEVDIHGSEPEGYKALDFFGGTLKGIEEKLSYIAEMGITILYLNPIFEARSNHRYDTANYMNVDPILGTNDDFISLCQSAQDYGIRIILDGVFSHTGADSIYFNKYGHYPEKGAFQSLLDKTYSPYFNWYNIHQEADAITYDSWWGFEDLPAVRELDLSYLDYILGPEGVIRTWLRRGAFGFRLDVSDELPDVFLEELRRVVKDENPEAVILGEVWEDASNKISYGSYRNFLLGQTHDNVMGYPFRQAVIDFFGQHIAADEMIKRLEVIREHYPPAAFHASMNLLGSHDTTRFITAVAGAADPGNRELQMQVRLSEEEREFGLKALHLASFFQMTYPGTPSIYYGDEIAMDGYRDPFNRRTFNWDEVSQSSLRNEIAKLGRLRKQHAVLQSGHFEIVTASGRLLIFRRVLDENGCDVFGEKQMGVDRIVVAINADAKALKIRTSQGKQYILPAHSGSLIIHGEHEVYSLSTGSDSAEASLSDINTTLDAYNV